MKECGSERMGIEDKEKEQEEEQGEDNS